MPPYLLQLQHKPLEMILAGGAAFACAILDSGYFRNQVYALLDTLEAQIISGGSTYWRDEKEMVEGFNNQASRNHRNCPLRISD